MEKELKRLEEENTRLKERIQQLEEQTLSNDEIFRYGRQLLLPNIGIEGQKRLKHAKVLVVGAGGLGASAIYYLAAAGIGTIGIVDHDTVELNNLHRQIIHNESRIGLSKAYSASLTVKE
jgi:adenylyltransferase/sulfurtransferase